MVSASYEDLGADSINTAEEQLSKAAIANFLIFIKL
jgi:hypothetical protein